MAEGFSVDVVYALPDGATVISVQAHADNSAEQLVRDSGMLARHPEIDLTKNKLGVFSRQVKADYQVQPGERIEIYRPLIADPKEVRKRRAEQAKAPKAS
ncbi:MULTISPECIES: RnfH family protein [Ferrimonas]|uniref:RnfH family protein n=1 Tax=Ferrimonas TaxID=44011 RepID=UPI000402E909|nr:MULTISPECIES: RnfH family protein [Ferrimonas]USD38434.1 RnfH family protein [Ferrimonas sp. SCSIO 43195]